VASVDVVGVYPVPEASEPVHLIELLVLDSPGFDPAKFVQPDLDEPEENWQVAYDERALNESGDVPITESFELSGSSELLKGDVHSLLCREVANTPGSATRACSPRPHLATALALGAGRQLSSRILYRQVAWCPRDGVRRGRRVKTRSQRDQP
jgi:hypothetical protein